MSIAEVDELIGILNNIKSHIKPSSEWGALELKGEVQDFCSKVGRFCSKAQNFCSKQNVEAWNLGYRSGQVWSAFDDSTFDSRRVFWNRGPNGKWTRYTDAQNQKIGKAIWENPNGEVILDPIQV